MPDLAEGDPAPDFDLPADGGGRVRLKDYKGRFLVLYFYPKDDTPGCTAEGVEFSAALPRFRKAGADIVGVSGDSPARHDRFKARHGLKIALASDENGEVLQAFGVWRKRRSTAANSWA